MMKFFALFMLALIMLSAGNAEAELINGVNLSVKQAGEGQAMILLHGKGYSKEYMDSLFNYYAKNYNVFSYDSRGHGQSDKPESFTLEDDADDLAGLIAHYGLNKPVIIGFSMGSYITLKAAEKYPELFSKIVLIGTRGRGDSYPSERISEAKDENDAAIIRALINFDLMTEINKVKIPVLLITGENDAVNPPAEAQKVSEALSNARFEVVPNAPHVAFMNEPERKLVFSYIDEFLRRQAMSEIYDFLKECGFYYLLTINGEYPSGRPISQILEKDGALYFGTRAGKAMQHQLTENHNVALIGFSKGRWLRLYAKVAEVNDMSIREQYLSRIPEEIERFGSAENPALIVYELQVVKAAIHSPGDKVEVIFSKE